MKPAIVIFEEGLHLIDHLAPLAVWLKFPLLLPGIREYELVKEHYPETDVRLVMAYELTVQELNKHYNLILYSQFRRKAFEAEAELVGIKAMKTVCVPHGNSDKGDAFRYYFEEEEAMFVYGKRMKRFVEEAGYKFQNPITVGNWRKAYFDERADLYREKVEKEIFSSFKKRQPVILYAPTWGDEELFLDKILKALPPHYNLIVKWHPLFANARPGVLARYENRDNVLFLEEYPLIYPLLEKVDLYIGDLSSIGYDFLFFKRPLIFLGSKSVYSHRYGRHLTDLEKIGQEIDEALKTGGGSFEGYLETFDPRPPKEEVHRVLKDYLVR